MHTTQQNWPSAPTYLLNTSQNPFLVLPPGACVSVTLKRFQCFAHTSIQLARISIGIYILRCRNESTSLCTSITCGPQRLNELLSSNFSSDVKTSQKQIRAKIKMCAQQTTPSHPPVCHLTRVCQLRDTSSIAMLKTEPISKAEHFFARKWLCILAWIHRIRAKTWVWFGIEEVIDRDIMMACKLQNVFV